MPNMLALVVLVVAQATTITTATTTTSAADHRRTLLFVDDHDVLYSAGLHQQLQPLERHSDSTPVITTDYPYEKLLSYAAVHIVDGEYRMWYQAYNTVGCVVCYATSRDGLNWTKPLLKLHSWGNMTETNIVFAEDPKDPNSGLYFGDVLYEPNASIPGRRFKMAVFDMPLIPGVKHGVGRPGVPGMYVAFSEDGIHWNRRNFTEGPVLVAQYGASPRTQPPFVGQGSDDGNSPFCLPGMGGRCEWVAPLSMGDVISTMRDPVSGLYRAYHKTWVDGPDGQQFWKRAVGVSVSQDFVVWNTTRRLIVAPDEFDGTAVENSKIGMSTSTELHNGPTYYHSTAGLYMMLLEVWENVEGGVLMHVELAISRKDGLHKFDRPFRKSSGHPYFLDVNPQPGNFDSSRLWPNGWPTPVGDSLGFFYGGYASIGGISPTDISGIGLATMKIDRYASLTPLGVVAQLTTVATSFRGVCNVTANVDTTPHGASIRIELLDSRGYRVPGFDQTEAAAIAGVDSVVAPVRWSAKAIADLSVNEEWSFRVHFNGTARLFALDLHPCV